MYQAFATSLQGIITIIIKDNCKAAKVVKKLFCGSPEAVNLPKIRTIFSCSTPRCSLKYQFSLYGVSSSSGSPNYFSYDGKTYNLDKGFIENFGVNSENGSYDFDVYLVSDSIHYSIPDEDFIGIGDMIYLDLNTSSENGLVAGTYKFSNNRDTFTLVDGLVGIKMDINTEEGEELVEIATGEVDVSIS